MYIVPEELVELVDCDFDAIREILGPPLRHLDGLVDILYLFEIAEADLI